MLKIESKLLFDSCELTIISLILDAEAFSPEPILREETHEAEEEAGSFSPELLHGDDLEAAIDPEEDKAILVP